MDPQFITGVEQQWILYCEQDFWDSHSYLKGKQDKQVSYSLQAHPQVFKIGDLSQY